MAVWPFIYSLSSSPPYPSVADWWRTVRLHTDQTGSNVTGNFVLSGEFYDSRVSLAMQFIIKTAVKAHLRALYLHPHNGLHLVLTSQETDVLKKHKTKLVVQLWQFPNGIHFLSAFTVQESFASCNHLIWSFNYTAISKLLLQSVSPIEQIPKIIIRINTFSDYI